MLFLLSILTFTNALTAKWMNHVGKEIYPPRGGFATDYDFNSNQWLFGGLLDGRPGPVVNDLWCKEKNDWNIVEIEGIKPRVRMYSAGCVTVGPSKKEEFIIFGGWDTGAPGSGGDFLDDIWSFDLESSWKPIGKLPYKVSRHTANKLNTGDILLHTYKCDDSVLLYDPIKRKFRQKKVTGKAPVGLSMMASASDMYNENVVFFGGSDKNQQMTNSIFVLNTESWEWQEFGQLGKGSKWPEPRSSSCLTCIGPGKFILFGGAGIAPGGYKAGGLAPYNDLWIIQLTNGHPLIKPMEVSSFYGMPVARLASWLTFVTDDQLILEQGWNPTAGMVEDSKVLRLQYSDKQRIYDI